MIMRRMVVLFFALLPVVALSAGVTVVQGASTSTGYGESLCQQRAYLCLDPFHSIGEDGAYTGHDEPTVQFSSHRPGTGGKRLVYNITLPRNASVKPNQAGTGGT